MLIWIAPPSGSFAVQRVEQRADAFSTGPILGRERDSSSTRSPAIW